jgi:hypothetical protein
MQLILYLHVIPQYLTALKWSHIVQHPHDILYHISQQKNGFIEYMPLRFQSARTQYSLSGWQKCQVVQINQLFREQVHLRFSRSDIKTLMEMSLSADQDFTNSDNILCSENLLLVA